METLDRQILWDTSKRLVRNQREKARDGLYPLEMLILYVTMRCNAKCDHCFCWEDLNVGIPEMSLEEIEKVAESLDRPLRHLLLTGGEPTLRKDLAGIVRAFASRDKVETVFINTNGLKPKLIASLAEELKTEFPHVGLEFQLSLDGLRETHDAIRGVPGNFDKVIETLKVVYELRKHYPHLLAHALTVICEKNYREFRDLNRYLRENVSPDIVHGFELVRDVEETAWNIPPEVAEKGVGPKKMNLPPREAFPQIERDLCEINRTAPWKVNSFLVHNLAQLKMVETGREQYKCVTAGQSVGVLYSNGDAAHCEFTLPFANLKDFDFDFMDLWDSDAAWKRRRQVSGCWCIHGCFHGKAVEYSWKGIYEMARLAMQSGGAEPAS